MNFIYKVLKVHRVNGVFAVTNYKRFKSKYCKTKMKILLQKRNPLTGSSEWGVEDEDYDYHQEITRSAFADMLHDTERNKKYYKAIQLAIDKMHSEGKQANVLDIGTGTGLLSMMAAKCGADRITACEAFKPMADCCLKILARNGYSDKIKVIPKRSTEIVVGEDLDMEERANILVTEVFDTELIGEGALSTFSHAHKHLLEKDCIVIPDSAVMYAQVIDCPTMQKWNKVYDIDDPDIGIKTPQNIKQCAGTASVHDLQLSQLPRSSFRELSDKIPVFHYDWSGKTPLAFNQTVHHNFAVERDGLAQMVFMWWELNMDPEGKILLSCAPWWHHPDADMSVERPQETIPWRDHWMQAIYYLPEEIPVQKHQEYTLVSCQDEYSLWFYLDQKGHRKNSYPRPICECGLHMAWSRTHVSYLNDDRRRQKFIKQLKKEIDSDSVVLNFNASSLLPVLSAKIAKTVLVHESESMNSDVLKKFLKENKTTNVNFLSDSTVLNHVTHVVCDPNFSNALLPWENLRVAHLLLKYKDKLPAGVMVYPCAFELWAMPVEFQDLHKIRVPLHDCEGFNMEIFDELVENSRIISDAEVEPQPLWEYPCKSSGDAQKLLDIDFSDLKPKYAVDGAFPLTLTNTEEHPYTVNGFALWVVWDFGAKHSTGPITSPVLRERIQWDPHTQQAVKIFKMTHYAKASVKWTFQVACDLENGPFSVNVDLVDEDNL